MQMEMTVTARWVSQRDSLLMATVAEFGGKAKLL